MTTEIAWFLSADVFHYFFVIVASVFAGIAVSTRIPPTDLLVLLHRFLGGCASTEVTVEAGPSLNLTQSILPLIL